MRTIDQAHYSKAECIVRIIDPDAKEVKGDNNEAKTCVCVCCRHSFTSA